ncbi:cation:proton antiporter [Marivirga sp. S37H4]|uniref:Cation:proton antiporter n=1 Tax=Marivirga aurantiaca TaxID=2802615 RepID=A0A935C8Q2_9BACT|nr:cation:proton antiporter [Marivirga aurantiaca]MBK6265736.1 cation:proton antiporter [Marivirga aurantiaca]
MILAANVEIPILSDIVVILGLAIFVILLFRRLKVPPIIGFLITGIIAGPYGFQMIDATEGVRVFAEIGVILLLFIIGIEFSIKSLASIKKAVFIGGTIQVFATVLVVSLVAYNIGFELNSAIFLGFIFSLSSTAIVLNILKDKGETATPHGKTILAILIFQDIIVVPMMLFTPLLAGESSNIWLEILSMLVKAALLIAFVLVSAKYIVPWLFYQIAKTKSKEMFVLVVVLVCFSVAWLSSFLGLSLALGAFLAGIIISESEYSHQAASNILPFHELFTSFFFVSIGMLLDIFFVADHFLIIVALTMAVIIVKGIIATFAGTMLAYPARTSLRIGLSLFQVGEFAFILATVGLTYGLISDNINQYFLSVSLFSMGITPIIIGFSGKWADKIASNKIATKLGEQTQKVFFTFSDTSVETSVENEDLDKHIVIIGFGLNGRNVAKAAKSVGIPYIISELNTETIRKHKAEGEPIIYGDAIQPDVLKSLSVHKAKVIVIAISDTIATRRIISNIRMISSTVHIIVRTRFITEVEENLRLGADEVIPEEFETSVEIFTRVLNQYLVPQKKIKEFIRGIRSDNYEMLRGVLKRNPLQKITEEFPDLTTASYEIERDHSEITNKPISETNIRKNFGVTVIGIKRGLELNTQIGPETTPKKGDIIIVFGKPEDLEHFYEKISI